MGLGGGRGRMRRGAEENEEEEQEKGGWMLNIINDKISNYNSEKGYVYQKLRLNIRRNSKNKKEIYIYMYICI